MADVAPSALRDLYRTYLSHCNEHRFDRLGEFVARDVEVNGATQGLAAYAQGLEAVVEAFPDYHWDLRHLLVDGCWLAAHFIDTGTHEGTSLGVEATGRTVSTQEFAVYRYEDDKIAEVWVTADDQRLLAQLR